MLADNTSTLISVVQEPASGQEQIDQAVQVVLSEADSSSPAEINAALARLVTGFEINVPERSRTLAKVAGALVEKGGDPLAIAEPLTERLLVLFASAQELAAACQAKLQSEATPDEDMDAEATFHQMRESWADTMPQQTEAWEALERLWPSAVDVFSQSAAARKYAATLRKSAAQLAPFHPAGHWLSVLLNVLEEEPILVIEVASALGIVGRISGVVDNFQLNTLLMDAMPLPGFFSSRRVSKGAVKVYRGEGPQSSNDTVTGAWNLYTWKAIESGLSLPDAADSQNNAEWIWNEASPADIPQFEGYRTILLGPASYPRMWQAQRMFNLLKGDLVVDQELSKGEAQQWLQKMAIAKAQGSNATGD